MQAVTAMVLPRNNGYVWGIPFYFGGLRYGTNSDNILNLIEGVYQHSGNLHNSMLNMATALTNNLAEVQPAKSPSNFWNDTDYYDGIATRSETFFKIRWGKSFLVRIVLKLLTISKNGSHFRSSYFFWLLPSSFSLCVDSKKERATLESESIGYASRGCR